ncbi:unnamed protein product [Sympodiomycopsis kandeliae]
MATTEPTASSSGAAPAAQEQVPLTLKTSIPDLAVPSTSYLVPTSFSRSHLSTLVNRLLEQTAGLTSTIPFDFIVDGQLLRESLSSWLDKNGKTIEEGIEVEYIKSTLPPQWSGAFEHDDWVASIDASRPGAFLTASYDSAFRLYSYDSPQEAVLTHKVAASGSAPQSLVDARWVGSSSRVATAGLDGSVRLFQVPEPNLNPEAPGQTYTSQPHQLWYGLHTHPSKSKLASVHTMAPSALTSVHASEDGSALLSASRDGSIAYWKLSDVEASLNEDEDLDVDGDDQGQRKRRKGATNGSKKSSLPGAGAKKPSALVWHSQPVMSNSDVYVPSSNSRVSRAIFARGSSDRAFSAGYDGKVIEWDLFSATQGGNPKLTQKTSDKVILCLDQQRHQSSPNSATLITGHMDRSIGIWDLRTQSSNISLLLPNAHNAPVYSITSHPIATHLLTSSSGDGVVKLFDTRSPKKALFSLTRPGTATGSKEKLLATDWDRDGQIVLAGGEDCKVNIFRGSGIGN